jgi:hypothetical protein
MHSPSRHTLLSTLNISSLALPLPLCLRAPPLYTCLLSSVEEMGAPPSLAWRRPSAHRSREEAGCAHIRRGGGRPRTDLARRRPVAHGSSEEEVGRTEIQQVQLSPSPSLSSPLHLSHASLSLFADLLVWRAAGPEPADLSDGSI